MTAEEGEDNSEEYVCCPHSIACVKQVVVGGEIEREVQRKRGREGERERERRADRMGGNLSRCGASFPDADSLTPTGQSSGGGVSGRRRWCRVTVGLGRLNCRGAEG